MQNCCLLVASVLERKMSRYFYFLHAFKLPSALIAQGLAEKNTGAKRG